MKSKQTRLKGMLTILLAALLAVAAGAWAAGAEDQAPPGPAGETEADVPQLGEMVVTASRRAQAVETAPAAVSVITAEDIAELPWENLGDLLENEVGIRINQPQGQGVVTPQSVTIRGLRGTERNLLLMDGQIMNSGWSDYWYFSQIPVEAIDRVEVVYGPYSALYGSYALGGVVQVFTKDGWGSKPGVSLGVRAGNFGRVETFETAQGEILPDRFSFFVSHSYYQTDNYLQTTEAPEEVIDIAGRDHSRERVHGNFRVKPSDDFDINVSGGAWLGNTGFGIGPQLAVDRNTDVSRGYANLRGSWRPEETLDVFFGADYLLDDRLTEGEAITAFHTVYFPPPPRVVADQVVPSDDGSGFERGRLYGGANWQLAENNVLTLGTEAYWTHGWMSVTNTETGELIDIFGRPGERFDGTEGLYAAYAQDDWMLWKDKVELVLGLRYDYHDAFGSEVSPKGALNIYYMKNGRIRLAGGRAFRAPPFSHRKAPPWILSAPRIWESTPDLKPETVTTYEVGFENEFLGKRLRTRVVPFISFADDFLVTQSILQPPLIIMKPSNIQNVEIKGVDSEIEVQPIPELRLFFNHQYNLAKDADTGDFLPDEPLNTLHWGGAWYSRHFNDFLGVLASVVGRYYSGRLSSWRGTIEKLPSYTVWDARLGLDFWRRRFSVYADVYNLGNEQTYRTSMDDWLQMRSYLIGFNVNLSL